MTREPLYGPTFAELANPALLAPALAERARAARAEPLSPDNLFNLHWYGADGALQKLVLPKALTGIDANIIVLTGRHFPTGAHKVGPAYSLVVEKQLEGATAPGRHTLVFPSTGNFGIGGAWVGPRMGYASTVVLPADMSAERFEKIRGYGAEVIATPGSESNVKEIFDKVHELRRDPKNCILNQFAELGNYRYHYAVTGAAAAASVSGVGDGRVAAFVSAMGSAGTIAAGDYLKAKFASCATVALEPQQCPTLYDCGYGAHAIEGIGDKHVTWIHNVLSTDLLFCIDDAETLRGLQLFEEGTATLVESGVPEALARSLVGVFGMSGICNVLGAIKTARALGLGAGQNVVTVATDGFDRYPSVLQRLTQREGPQTREVALRRLELFHHARTDWMLAGTREVRRRWHNQKYYTWVEQQGKSVAELDAMLSPEFWLREQARVAELDRGILATRGATHPGG